MKKKFALVALVLVVAAALVFIPPLAAQLSGNSSAAPGGAPAANAGSSGAGGRGAGGSGAGAAPGGAPASGTANAGGKGAAAAGGQATGGRGGAAGANGGAPASGGRGGAGGGTVFSVKTEEVQTENLAAYLEVNGDVVSDEQVVVFPDAAGKLVSMKVSAGSSVRRGQLIAEVDPSRPGTEYALSPVYAPVSGTVLTTPLAAGSTVTTGSSLFTIGAAGSLAIEALIPERSVGSLRMGLPALVKLEAFPDEEFPARLSRLAPVIDTVSRTKKVSIRFNTPDSRINAGMFARVKLTTRVYENVITIPESAVVESGGVKKVYVLGNDNGEERVSARDITAGVSVDGRLEIKEGLAAGEKIVTHGQRFLTDGAKVRVLQ